MCSLNQFFNAINYALRKTDYHNLFLKVKQYQILESVIRKRDTIGILPTGYGKSVIFHLLPFVTDYLTSKTNVDGGNNGTGKIVLVVTPLNALIENQISILHDHGINAAVLKTVKTQHTDRDGEEEDTETTEFIDCEENTNVLLGINTTDFDKEKVKIIYAHPEAFISCKEGRRLLISSVLQKNVFACVIDEGHLVQEWGIDFRKDFAKLSQMRSLFPDAPFLVLTATAPKHLQEAIANSLHLDNPKVVIANLDRPNIFLHKKKRLASSEGEESFRSILLPIANGLKNRLRQYPLTLIYLPLKWCGYAFKLFMDELGEESYFPPGDRKPENCLFAQFHAPQTQSMKTEILKQLQGEDKSRSIRVVFATIALGIGVNIFDIRHVIHISVPGTIESLYQEIGRAGRDGKQAKASIYYNGHDISQNKRGMTTVMRHFCLDEEKCLRKIVLDYLGSSSRPVEIMEKHACCSNCYVKCECLSCQAGKSIENAADICQTDDTVPTVRNVSDAQRAKIKSLMQSYRLQLGKKGHHIGGIDTRTGVTLDLIESVVARCEQINSAEDMFLKFEIWDIKHAHNFFEVISSVCKQ